MPTTTTPTASGRSLPWTTMRPPPPSCSPPIFPRSTVVKAFNTMHYATLASGGHTAKPRDDRLAIFVAGDNGQANSIVSELIEELGFTAVHTGGLADGGRRQQPGSPVFAATLTPAQAWH